MRVDVENEIVIHRRREDVAAFASDPDNATRWYANIKQVEWLSPKPLAVGSRLAFIAHFLGRELRYAYEVTALDAGAKLVMRTADGPFPMETTYEFESVGADRTRMRLMNRGDPEGFSKLVGPFVGVAMRGANRKDLARLKELRERSPEAMQGS